MKYTYETTEGETKLILAFIESVTDKLINAALEIKNRSVHSTAASDLSPSEGQAEPALKERIKYGEVQYGAKSPRVETIPSDAEYADMDFSNYQDIPEEYKNIKPPIWLPDTKKVGSVAFQSFLRDWEVNLGIEGAEQPDRPTLMRELANHPKVLYIIGHIAECGGLTYAVAREVVGSWPLPTVVSEEAKTRVNLIATTMCQVSSILFPDMAQMYEHRDIFKERK